MGTTIVDLNLGDQRDESYGIAFRSKFVYRVSGRGLHNPTYPHRLKVWDNSNRLNPRNGERVRYGQYGKIDGGDGKYLDPNHNATDSEFSYLLGAESTVLAGRYSTGSADSGQVYAKELLEVGEFVVLRYPDGTLSDPFRIAARSLADPELVPVS